MKLKLICLFSFLHSLSINSNAQNPDFIKFIGIDTISKMSGMIVQPWQSPMAKSPTGYYFALNSNYDTSYATVVKTDLNFNIQASKKFNAEAGIVIYKMLAHSDGYLYFATSGPTFNPVTGYTSTCFVKCDSNFNIVYTKHINGIGAFGLASILQMKESNDGSILVVGSDGSINGSFVGKISQAGQIIWQTYTQMNESDKLEESPNGSIYFVTDFLLGSSIYPVLTKLSATGSIIYQKRYNRAGYSDSRISKMCYTPNNTLKAVGYSATPSIAGENFILELDTNGIPITDNRIVFSSANEFIDFYSMKQKANGNFIANGIYTYFGLMTYTANIEFTPADAQVTFDYYIDTMSVPDYYTNQFISSTQGNVFINTIEFVNTMPSQYCAGFYIRSLPADLATSCPSNTATFTAQPFPVPLTVFNFTPAGGPSAALLYGLSNSLFSFSNRNVVSYDLCGATMGSHEIMDRTSINAYFSGQTLYLESTNDLSMHITIYDVSGKQVYDFDANGTKTAHNLHKLAKGFYMAQVTDCKSVSAVKFVKAQ